MQLEIFCGRVLGCMVHWRILGMRGTDIGASRTRPSPALVFQLLGG